MNQYGIVEVTTKAYKYYRVQKRHWLFNHWVDITRAVFLTLQAAKYDIECREFVEIRKIVS
jgi:hypothetical protein